MANPVLFDEVSAKRIANAVRAVERSTPRRQQARRLNRSVAAPPIQWGKVQADWSTGQDQPNQIALTRCTQTGAEIDEDDARTVYVHLPTYTRPTAVDLHAGDVVAYVPFFDEAEEEMRGVLIGSPAGEARIRLGKPTEAYSSGATITLDPCDSAGDDNGEDNVTVQAGWTLPDNTNIPTSAIIPFQQAADGKWYVIGQPKEVATNFNYDTTTHKLQKKVRYDWGAFCTTESSEWVDITTAVNCTEV